MVRPGWGCRNSGRKIGHRLISTRCQPNLSMLHLKRRDFLVNHSIYEFRSIKFPILFEYLFNEYDNMILKILLFPKSRRTNYRNGGRKISNDSHSQNENYILLFAKPSTRKVYFATRRAPPSCIRPPIEFLDDRAHEERVKRAWPVSRKMISRLASPSRGDS